MFSSSRIVLVNKRFLLQSRNVLKHFKCTTSCKSQFQGNKDDCNSFFGSVSNYQRYFVSSAITLSALGAYYLYNSELKKVFALEQNKCGTRRNDLRTYTAEEVGKHDSKKTGIWISYKEGVYDITDFVDKHPGGPKKIMMAAGSSIEPFWNIFANHHQNDIYQLLESMRIGNLSQKDVNLGENESDDPYANEPKRHKALIINGHKPFCAEPPSSLLVESFETPTELFYVRNHLPVPEIDINDYSLELSMEDVTKRTLKLEELKKYPKYSVTSAIMCGGNRRSEMASEKPLKGLSWSVGAVGNATWSGARLCDVLKDLNIDEEKYNHVQFEGLDYDPSGSPYGSSIPLGKALDPRSDVILAYEMNGEAIPLDHGFPVRVIVPGVVGARNVKWLGKIIVSKEESPAQWQQGDYKGFSPSTTWETVDFSKAPAIQEMPVTSAICVPESGEKVSVKNGKISVKGYAWSGGGKKIIRVDITADKGETWHTADLIAEDQMAKPGRYYSWSLWSLELPVDIKNKEIEIWAKAVDSSYNVQPESFKNIWNLRGFLCNAYHRVKVQI